MVIERVVSIGVLALASLALGCAGSGSDAPGGPGDTAVLPPQQPTAGAGAAAVPSAGIPPASPGSGGASAGVPGMMSNPAAMAGAPATPGMPAGAGSDPVVAPPPVAPTGDPNGTGEVVSIPEVRCGPAAGLDAFVAGTGIPGPGTPNVQIGGRDVVLSYPCDKREGAHVTFILNLHGTMPDETLKTYQHGYFSAHRLATSHNLIVATPKSMSPVGQWGNGDNGVDTPHLYEVVDWVYSTFSKFQITALWIGGHSWGSAFTKSFVCDPMFVDKARGAIGMSGGPTGVGGLGGGDCAARLSQIHTNGELEGGEAGVPDQTAAASAHGCGARLAPRDIGNGQILYEWPDCDPGWVHFNFVMGAHEHITAIDDPVVLHIVEAIKSTEKL